MAKTKTPTIGQMLREARLNQNMPITTATRELGVARQTYYHWEDDYAVPKPENAGRIAAFCDVPVPMVLEAILRATDNRAYEQLKSFILSSGDTVAYVRRLVGGLTSFVRPASPSLVMVGGC